MLNKGQANCCSLLSEQDIYTLYKSCQYWSMVTVFIQELPMLIYIDLTIYNLILKGPAQLLFNPSFCWHAAIMGLVCRLLAGKGWANLPIYCPQLCGNPTHRRFHWLHSWDPAEHLRLVNPCNFKTLDRFKCSWLATATDIWNGLPADMILQGKVSGWHTILKDRVLFLSDILMCILT